MNEQNYQLFFRVVDHYVIKDNLILVSDRTDSGRARTLETIQVKCPGGGNAKVYTAGCVSYWQMPGEKPAPFCMAIKGLKPEQIPIGSTVWLEEREIANQDLSRYRKIKNSPAPMPGGMPDISQPKSGKKQAV